MAKPVPKWLHMPPNTKARLLAWIRWRLDGDPSKFDYKALERDGSYDLYRHESNSESKRRDIFRTAYNQITKPEFERIFE